LVSGRAFIPHPIKTGYRLTRVRRTSPRQAAEVDAGHVPASTFDAAYVRIATIAGECRKRPLPGSSLTLCRPPARLRKVARRSESAGLYRAGPG